jgi:hypothetical protein
MCTVSWKQPIPENLNLNFRTFVKRKVEYSAGQFAYFTFCHSWDDGTEMQMLLEGNQTVDGVIYPKQISTYKNKAEVGIYLRKRIGEKIGLDLTIPEELSKTEFRANADLYKDKLITREMLDKYGRTSITIKLIGDSTYYFDFSPTEE